ncbi:MAG: hypothetical protein R3310_13360, partial [Candidatus Competibacteraceae bacterium]|nr:hypothetical protein [Candidatus Competibacteraceae bacterium]
MRSPLLAAPLRLLLVLAGLLLGAGPAPASIVTATEQVRPWVPLGPNNASVFAMAPAADDPAEILVGTYFGGLYRTRNQGLTWSHVVSPFSTSPVLAIAQGADTLYIGTFGAGLFRSRDEGLTWTRLAVEAESINALAARPGEPDMLLVATEEAVLRSEDGGATWHNTTLGLALVPRTLALDPHHPDQVYLGTLRQGVLHSRDGGRSWQPFREGLGELDVIDLQISPDGSRLLAATNDGAYRLNLGQERWQDISYDLPVSQVNQLIQHPDGRLFAATGQAVYRLLPEELRWVPWAEVPSRLLLFAPEAGLTYVAATYSKLLATVDDGANFFPIDRGIQNVFAGSLLDIEINGQSLLIAGTDLGIKLTSPFFAVDDFQPWVAGYQFNQGVFGLTAVPDQP